MHNLEFRSEAINPTECFRLGWETFKSRIWLFLGLCLFLGFPVGTIIRMISPFPELVTQGFSAVVGGGISAGIYYIVLTEIDGKRADFTMIAKVIPSTSAIAVVALIGAVPGLILFLFVGGKARIGDTFWLAHFIAASGLPIFLLIALGFLVSFFLYFAYPLIAEYRLGALDAIKLSSSAAAANIRGIVLLGVLNFLIFLGATVVGVLFLLVIGTGAMAPVTGLVTLTMIPLWVSLAAAVSVSYATVSHAYRQVFPKTEESVI